MMSRGDELVGENYERMANDAQPMSGSGDVATHRLYAADAPLPAPTLLMCSSEIPEVTPAGFT